MYLEYINKRKMATFMKTVTYCDVLSSALKRYKYFIPNGSMPVTRNYSISAQNHENYDIIITGGGMVGTTLACAIG